jgi:hypothetical protein
MGKDSCDNCGTCSKIGTNSQNVSSDGDVFQMNSATGNGVFGASSVSGVSSVTNQSTNSTIANALEAYASQDKYID